jgi:uncharacterized protein (UPF0332 family)
MKPKAAAFIKKAERSIASARLQLSSGYPEFAAGSAYYAMFYIAEALLENKGLAFSSHGAVHGAFGKEFAKPELMDPRFHRAMLDAFRLRQEGEYNTETISKVSAEEVIRDAEEFLSAAKASALLE